MIAINYDHASEHPCRKFATCSVPICPLDNEWQQRRHVKSEAICPYLLEYAKVAKINENTGYIEGVIGQSIQRHYPAIKSAYSDITRRLAVSANTPSRLNLVGVR